MDEYLDSLAIKNYSEQTIETRRRMLINFLQWAEARERIVPRQITKLLLQRYQHHLWCHRKRNGQPLAAGTQAARLGAVRCYLDWLRRQGCLGTNPAADLEMPRVERRLPQDTLSEEQVEAIIQAVDVHDPLGVRNRAILEVLYSTGIRRMELARLELHDLNPSRRTLAIRHEKGNRDRFVPLGERAFRWVEAFLEKVRPMLEVEAAEPALFLTGYGRGFSPGSLGNLVRKAIEKAGVDRRGGCHLFRHSCATHMLERGADIRVIQQLLGHAKLETTMIYTEVSISLLREVHARTHPTARA